VFSSGTNKQNEDSNTNSERILRNCEFSAQMFKSCHDVYIGALLVNAEMKIYTFSLEFKSCK